MKTSTYVGVEYEASTKKWRAVFGLPDGNVKLVLAGLYNTQIEAALAFDEYARSVLDPQEASRVVNFTVDGAPNPNENLCRVVLDKIEERMSESNDTNGTSDSPPTKGTDTSPDMSYRFVSFLKTKLSNMFGFTSENNKQSNGIRGEASTPPTPVVTLVVLPQRAIYSWTEGHVSHPCPWQAVAFANAHCRPPETNVCLFWRLHRLRRWLCL